MCSPLTRTLVLVRGGPPPESWFWRGVPCWKKLVFTHGDHQRRVLAVAVACVKQLVLAHAGKRQWRKQAISPASHL